MRKSVRERNDLKEQKYGWRSHMDRTIHSNIIEFEDDFFVVIIVVGVVYKTTCRDHQIFQLETQLKRIRISC